MLHFKTKLFLFHNCSTIFIYYEYYPVEKAFVTSQWYIKCMVVFFTPHVKNKFTPYVKSICKMITEHFLNKMQYNA